MNKTLEEGIKLFSQYEVKADSVKDFLDKYYKPQRYIEWGAEYAAELLSSHERDFKENGYDIISHHDSVTGRVVAYFGKK